MESQCQEEFGRVDALYSIVQMPPGIPVATVAIDGGANAAILAAKILATSDPELLDRLKAYTKEMKENGTGKSSKIGRAWTQRIFETNVEHILEEVRWIIRTQA